MAGIDQQLDRAKAAWAVRDLPACAAACTEILAARPGDFTARMLLGDVRSARGDLPGAAREMELAIAARPKDARARMHVARTWLGAGDPKKALRHFERARALASDDAGRAAAAAGMAGVHEILGHPERARRAIADIPDGPGGVPRPEIAEIRVRDLLREGREGEVEPLVERVRTATPPPPPDAVHRGLLHGVARARERAGDVDGAFAAAAEANAMDPPPYDPDATDAFADTLIAWWTPERLATMPTLPEGVEPTDVPVFIVGMPRCGSTLLERILHAHPRAAGAGELGTLDVVPSPLAERIGRDEPLPGLLEHLAAEHVAGLARDTEKLLRRRAPGARRVVNKELFNLWHLGLIATALPRATVIHMQRDPVDTGLSCFMERLPRGSCPWACDLEHIARYWRTQDRVAAHFRDLVPNPWIGVSYEALVADLEGTARRVVEALGLDWDPRCLEFHSVRKAEATASIDQVRRPLYATSVGRAERFAAHLGALASLPRG
jgi:hypothetical protein